MEKDGTRKVGYFSTPTARFARGLHDGLLPSLFVADSLLLRCSGGPNLVGLAACVARQNAVLLSDSARRLRLGGVQAKVRGRECGVSVIEVMELA